MTVASTGGSRVSSRFQPCTAVGGEVAEGPPGREHPDARWSRTASGPPKQEVCRGETEQRHHRRQPEGGDQVGDQQAQEQPADGREDPRPAEEDGAEADQRQADQQHGEPEVDEVVAGRAADRGAQVGDAVGAGALGGHHRLAGRRERGWRSRGHHSHQHGAQVGQVVDVHQGEAADVLDADALVAVDR